MEKFSFLLPGKSENLCILMVQQLGRCRITASSFGIQTTTTVQDWDFNKHSPFCPSPLWGAGAVLQEQHLHSSPAASRGFLCPALFHHPAANPKVIFHWFKSTKAPERAGISLGAPRAPETPCLSLQADFFEPSAGQAGAAWPQG